MENIKAEKTMGVKEVIEEASRCLLCLDAPCSKMCPAGTDPAKFIRSVRFLNFKGAAETIRENNPLGSLCARLCPVEKYCELGCLRSGIDHPIDIAAIQTYVTDFEKENNMQILAKGVPNGKKVAIVGSGPSALSAAAELAREGYSVTVYEKQSKIGGYLRYGIPEYRLPTNVLDYEIERIKNLGVQFVLNKNIGIGIPFSEIEKSFDAVIVCLGLGKGKMIPPFVGKENVITAVDLLSKLKEGEIIELPDTVLVVGGGDVAMDVITSLKNKGVKKVVDVVYEEMNEFKASNKEKEIAFPLVDSLICGYIPTNMTNNEVEFKHRFIDSTLKIKAGLIVLAVGQEVDSASLPFVFKKGEAERYSEKVFFAGDIAHDDKSVVAAVKTGKEAAENVAKILGGK